MNLEKDNKKSYFVHPTAIIEDGAIIGEGTKIWHFVHVRRGAKIGKYCNIGKDVYIDVDVQVGDRVKVQNGVSIYRGVKIEDDVFIGPHVTFTNDLYPRSFNKEWQVIPTYVKHGASIGANATILCGIEIGEYAMVGAGAVVTKDVPPHGLVIGNPARLKGFVCFCGRPLMDNCKIKEEDLLILYICKYCGKEVCIRKESKI